jgi:hypothetical protein
MRQSGRLFFGNFLLAAQKKVTRLSVREPTLKKRRLRLLKSFFYLLRCLYKPTTQIRPKLPNNVGNARCQLRVASVNLAK